MAKESRFRLAADGRFRTGTRRGRIVIVAGLLLFGLVLTFCFGSHVKSRGALIGWEEGVDKQAVDEIKKHFGIVAEGLESKIEIIAEGHALLRTEMKSGFGELKTESGELRSEVDVVRNEVGGLRSEVGGLRSEVGELKIKVGDVDSKVGELTSNVGEFKSEFTEFRSEVKQDFSDVRSMIKL